MRNSFGTTYHNKGLAGSYLHSQLKNIGSTSEPDYCMNLLRCQIIRRTFLDYAQAEKKINELESKEILTRGEKITLRNLLKVKQECVDFFHSYWGNRVAFDKGEFFADAMVNHLVNINKLHSRTDIIKK